MSGNSLQVQQATVDSAEHEAVVGLSRAHLQPLGRLAFPVLPKGCHGGRVQRDGAPTLRSLRRPQQRLMVDRDERLADLRRPRCLS